MNRIYKNTMAIIANAIRQKHNIELLIAAKRAKNAGDVRWFQNQIIADAEQSVKLYTRAVKHFNSLINQNDGNKKNETVADGITNEPHVVDRTINGRNPDNG